MNKRTSLTLVLVALLVVPGLTTAAVLGSPDLSARFTDNTVTPGQQTALELVVLNEGELDQGGANAQLNSEVTTARGLSVRVGNGSAPFTVLTGKQAVGSLPEGASSPIPFQIVVHDDADPGSYQVPITVDYTHTSYISETDGSRDQEHVVREFTVPVRVESSAGMDVLSVNSTTSVGSQGTVELTVQNDGTETARDAQLTLTSRSGDVTLGQSASASQHVGTWEPGENKTVTFSTTATNSAEASEYAFGLGATYEEANGRQRSVPEQPIGVPVHPEAAFAVEDVESTLEVGDEGHLSGVVRNTGDRTIEGVVLQWASEQRNVNPTETQYAVGSLASGETAEFDFDVEVSDAARSGPRQFSLVAQYRDGDQTRRSDGIDVRQQVGPARDEFDVTVESANLTAGSSSTVELNLTNAADQTLTDVSAKIFANAPVSTSDDEAFVSELEPGESRTLTFSISAATGALEKTYPLSMDVQYDEPDGDTVTSDTYSVPVGVDRSSGGGVPLTAIGGTLLLAVVAIAGYVRFR